MPLAGQSTRIFYIIYSFTYQFYDCRADLKQRTSNSDSNVFGRACLLFRKPTPKLERRIWDGNTSSIDFWLYFCVCVWLHTQNRMESPQSKVDKIRWELKLEQSNDYFCYQCEGESVDSLFVAARRIVFNWFTLSGSAIRVLSSHFCDQTAKKKNKLVQFQMAKKKKNCSLQTGSKKYRFFCYPSHLFQ